MKNFSTQTGTWAAAAPLHHSTSLCSADSARPRGCCVLCVVVCVGSDPAKDFASKPLFDDSRRVWQARADENDPSRVRFEPKSDASDVWTMIERAGDGTGAWGIFDFDVSAEPVLHVLVEKTIEQALQEVCSEEEAKVAAAYASDYSQQRTAELSEAQRILAAEQRKIKEKERRIKQAEDDARARKTVRNTPPNRRSQQREHRWC
jgi:hypothetical protein